MRKRFKGFFMCRSQKRKIEFDFYCKINPEEDELPQLKKRLDEKYGANVQLALLPNSTRFSITDKGVWK